MPDPSGLPFRPTAPTPSYREGLDVWNVIELVGMVLTIPLRWI